MSDPPIASVIVPVYNDPRGLATTLSALITQNYPRDRHEILVVDNGSTDGTRAVARRFSAANHHVKVLVEAELRGSYAARNRGIRHANGSILAFIDADMTVPVDWLADAVETIRSADVDYMGCDVRLFTPDARESLVARYNRLSGFPIARYLDQRHFAPTCCLVVRRVVFEEVGLFDHRLASGGDREFGHRVYDSGRTLHFASDVCMHHPTRGTVGSLLEKAVRVGRGRLQLRRFHPDRYGHPAAALLNPMRLLPPLPWRLRARFDRWNDLTVGEKLVFFALAFLASLANTAGMIREAVVMGRAHFGPTSD